MRSLHIFTAFFGWRVRGGPFRDMRYVRDSVCSTLAPKLLGTYECELNDWLAQLMARKYSRVLNIGAAEGYYAIGFARHDSVTRVIAFEAEANGRALISEMAALNGVSDRVAVEGRCTPELLNRHLPENDAPLLIVDIEGGEIELLDLQKVPALRHCSILIELHEQHEPAADILRDRFASTHTIEERWTRARRVRDLPVLLRAAALLFGSARLIKALAEHRPGIMRWFLCQPRVLIV